MAPAKEIYSMDIFNLKGLAGKVSTEPKFYDLVARFKRGERNCFTKDEIAKLKRAAIDGNKKLLAALDECEPKHLK